MTGDCQSETLQLLLCRCNFFIAGINRQHPAVKLNLFKSKILCVLQCFFPLVASQRVKLNAKLWQCGIRRAGQCGFGAKCGSGGDQRCCLKKTATSLKRHGDLIARGIIDPAKVTRSALQNAASIAALFLTTEAVIADKPEKSAAPAMPGGDEMGGMGF